MKKQEDPAARLESPAFRRGGASQRQPSTPGQAARKRLADAKRHLFAHIIASAHLLDTPFTNAPDQSPWSRMKHAMAGLDAAIAALDAAPATYSLPAEPPETVTQLWDHGGCRWERDSRPGCWRWAAPGQAAPGHWHLDHPEPLVLPWDGLLVECDWLSTTPPERTETGDA